MYSHDNFCFKTDKPMCFFCEKKSKQALLAPPWLKWAKIISVTFQKSAAAKSIHEAFAIEQTSHCTFCEKNQRSLLCSNMAKLSKKIPDVPQAHSWKVGSAAEASCPHLPWNTAFFIKICVLHKFSFCGRLLLLPTKLALWDFKPKKPQLSRFFTKAEKRWRL